MNNLSVVIIAKNEAGNIAACITSAAQVSSDIIVADNDSEDDTATIAKLAGARVLSVEWKGYGQTRNEAAAAAGSDWILAIDADERMNSGLVTAVMQLQITSDKTLYGFKRSNFLGDKKIRYGEWGRDKVYRLYNRQTTSWDLAAVHENIISKGLLKVLLPGELLHYTMKDIAVYKKKNRQYASLSATKYYQQGRQATFVKRYLAPVFGFVQNYIFWMGFLDGKEGFWIAIESARYVFLKYKLLHQLSQQEKQM